MYTTRQSLKDFVLNFSSHGFQRVFYPVGSAPTKVSKLFRVIWLVAWGSAAVMMTYQMSEIFTKYFEYGKSTAISITRETSIPFPAVTICSQNGLDKNRVVSWLNKCEPPTGVRIYDMLCYLPPAFQKDMDRTHVSLNTYIRKFFLELSNNHAAMGQLELARNLSFSRDNIMYGWGFGDKNYENFIDFGLDPVDFENPELLWKFSGYLVPEGSPPFRAGSCYTFNHSPQLGVSATEKSVLHVTLNKTLVQQDCFNSVRMRGNRTFCGRGCYVVILHAPGTVPMLTDKVEIVCESSHISFQYEVRSLLKAPYGDCVTNWGENATKAFRQANFTALHRYAYTEDSCLALDSVFRRFYSLALLCKPACSKNIYNTHSSIWPTPWDDESTIIVRVSHKRLEKKLVADVPAMTKSELLANVGGLLGLWLGASLLTLVEILELLGNMVYGTINWIIIKCQSLCGRNVVQSVQGRGTHGCMRRHIHHSHERGKSWS